MEQPSKKNAEGNAFPELPKDPWVVNFVARFKEGGASQEIQKASTSDYETIVFRTANSTYILHDNEDGTHRFVKIPGDGSKILPGESIARLVPTSEVAGLTITCGEQVIFGGEHGNIRTTNVVSIDTVHSVKRG